MVSCGLAILNSSEARTRSWLFMSSRTTARLIRLSPITSSYWAGRICCWITLAGERERSRHLNHSSPSEANICVGRWVKSGFTFHGCQLYDTVVFPDGVRGAVVEFFGLGIEMHLHHLGNALLIDGFHREADRLPGNRSFIQDEEDCHPLGRACWTNMKKASVWDDVCLNRWRAWLMPNYPNDPKWKKITPRWRWVFGQCGTSWPKRWSRAYNVKIKMRSVSICALEWTSCHFMSIFVLLAPTFDVFVVSCDVLGSGWAHGFGADKGSHSLCVVAVAEHSAVAHYDRVDVGVHLGVDKRDVVKQVNTPILDCFDRSWAAAEHS